MFCLDRTKSPKQKRITTYKDKQRYEDNTTTIIVASVPKGGGYTEKEQARRLRAASAIAHAPRGRGKSGVGIFWYNATRKELFGVVTHKRTDYLKPNAGGGLITCSEMHEDVWKKELRRQKYHGDGTGPFKGEYQMKPRGRVFYQPTDDQYIIAVGTWIDQSPEAIDQIIDEFDLPRQKTIVRKASHWDIGQTWND